MKRLLKKMARPFWRMSGPVRRPLIRKFDRHMTRLLGTLSPSIAPPPPPPPAVPADLDLILNSVVRELARPREVPVPGNLEIVLNSVVHELARSRAVPGDLDLALNSVVRELARLQMQVEALQQQIDDLPSSGRDAGRPEGRLSLVAEIG